MQKLLVVRNDKIGDFMLAWPAFAMLKQSLPHVQITALVPAYTQDLASLCPSIDAVIMDCGDFASSSAKKALIQTLKDQSFDAAICFFSNFHNAQLIWRAGIPIRFAPATKWCQFLYNFRITQRRSQSAKPEFAYNLDLSRAFLQHQHVEVKTPSTPYLSFEPSLLNAQKNKLAQQLQLNQSNPWVFVHVGSGGSANNLSLTQYADLIVQIAQRHSVSIILTAGPGEAEKTRQLQQLLNQQELSAHLYDKNDGLVDFTQAIACARIFIAGSTGPLHIAAALDVPTIGFFPAKRSATPLRWQPINSEGRHLAFAPPSDPNKAIASNMSRIEIQNIMPSIDQFIQDHLVS